MVVVVSSSTWWVGFVVADSSQSLSGDSLFGSALGARELSHQWAAGGRGREGRRGKRWVGSGRGVL